MVSFQNYSIGMVRFCYILLFKQLNIIGRLHTEFFELIIYKIYFEND